MTRILSRDSQGPAIPNRDRRAMPCLDGCQALIPGTLTGICPPTDPNSSALASHRYNPVNRRPLAFYPRHGNISALEFSGLPAISTAALGPPLIPPAGGKGSRIEIWEIIRLSAWTI